MLSVDLRLVSETTFACALASVNSPLASHREAARTGLDAILSQVAGGKWSPAGHWLYALSLFELVRLTARQWCVPTYCAIRDLKVRDCCHGASLTAKNVKVTFEVDCVPSELVALLRTTTQPLPVCERVCISCG